MYRSPGTGCDRHALDAMRRVPREAFVELGYEEFASKTASPIGEGQTISQSYIVALMIDAAEVKPGDCVLEVGANVDLRVGMAPIPNRTHKKNPAKP
jgi:protein-L-isoaspartate O-methyltransferase